MAEHFEFYQIKTIEDEVVYFKPKDVTCMVVRGDIVSITLFQWVLKASLKEFKITFGLE